MVLILPDQNRQNGLWLGHRSMRMTLVYARIADRTVADEYFVEAEKVDQLSTTHLTTSPA